jgi:hypothetical protein
MSRAHCARAASADEVMPASAPDRPDEEKEEAEEDGLVPASALGQPDDDEEGLVPASALGQPDEDPTDPAAAEEEGEGVIRGPAADLDRPEC